MLDRITLALRDAALRPATWNPDASTIDAVIASDAPVARRDAKGDFLEILDPAGADLSALTGASVLDGHRQDGIGSVIGTVESARVEGREIVARLRLSSRPELAPMVRDIADGIIRNLSVGYSVAEWRDGAADGKRTRTAVKWTPREVSFVAVPADRNAHTRSHDMTSTSAAGERPTINRAIRELAARAGVATTITDGLIDRSASIEDARAAILDDVIRRGSVTISPSASHASYDDPEFFRTAVADAMYARINPNYRPSDAARQYMGEALPTDIARLCLQRNGISTMGLGRDGLVTRGLESTSDYPAIMMNVLNKSLRVAYEAAPSGLKDVARPRTSLDFRPMQRIMLDSTAFQLQPIPETGEFKGSVMVDAAESFAVATYGGLFRISRKALVNDDLNAFGDVSRRLGIASAQFEAQTLADLLLQNAGLGPAMKDDGRPLFDPAHGNVAATGAAPAVDTLSDARLAMRLQRGKSPDGGTTPGGLISVVPSILVVGADLETTGEKLIAEIRPVTVDTVNPFSKLTRLVVEPRLPPLGWYVVADPGEIDGLEYAYLASAPGPQLEMRLGFEVDGLQVRVRLDFGAGFVDFRGWYRNAGSASAAAEAPARRASHTARAS